MICAAGAWSRHAGALAGVELPVSPLRRQVLFTEPMDNLPKRIPLTIDFSSTFYFHGEGPGLLFGMSDPTEDARLQPRDDRHWIPALLEAAERRAPRVAAAGIRGGWAGLYDMSPDHNAVIGEARDVTRFLYATGFSGHGFLQGPATGEILRDLVLRTPDVRRRRAAERRPLRRPRPAPRAQHRLMPAPSNVDVAADALREAIVRGRFKPGERSRRSRWRPSWTSRAARSATRCGCSSATAWSR